MSIHDNILITVSKRFAAIINGPSCSRFYATLDTWADSISSVQISVSYPILLSTFPVSDSKAVHESGAQHKIDIKNAV